MGDDAIIKVRNLKKQYDGRVILQDVSFDVKRGEIFVIVGGSGCGKSTLLRQLIGLEKPTDGEIWLDGEDFVAAEGKELNRMRMKFGILFQSGGLFASMTIAENIALPLETYTNLSKKRIESLINIKMEAVGLGGFQNFIPSEISGGMKKRAALARAMALDPQMLFFDEPSSGLDPITSADMDKLIMELNSVLGTTMIIVSHDLASILSISHSVVMLDKSKKGVIAIGTPQELQEMKDLKRVYYFFNRIPEF